MLAKLPNRRSASGCNGLLRPIRKAPSFQLQAYSPASADVAGLLSSGRQAFLPMSQRRRPSRSVSKKSVSKPNPYPRSKIMKVSLSRTLSVFFVLLSVFLAGCAGTLKQMPDGNWLGVTTAGDTLDRSASFIGEYKKVKGPDGKDAYQLIKPGQLSVGATVAGQALTAAVAGTLPAIIQGEALKDATKLGKCADGANCGTVNNVVANSGAASQSVNQNSSTLGVTTGGGCGSACKPNHAQ